MDHQIQHHRHIIGAISMGTVATPLENHHLFVGHHFRELTEGGVEPFDVAHLQQAPRIRCRLNQSRCFVLTRGNWLLDQHMQAGLQTCEANGMVQKCWHSNAHRLYFLEHAAVVREPAATELLDRQAAPIRIGISHTHQIRILQQAENSGVMPAHVADTNHPNLDRTHGVGRHRRAGVVGGRLSVFSRPSPPHPAERRAPVQSAGRPWP